MVEHGRSRLRGLSLRLRRHGVVRVHLVRVLRLVSGAHQAGVAIGRAPRPPRNAARADPRGDARSVATRAASLDALHLRGDLAARGAARRPSGPPSCWRSTRCRRSSRPTRRRSARSTWIQALILAVRQIRGEMNIAPPGASRCSCKGASEQDKAYAERHRAYLERLAGMETLTVLAAGATAPQVRHGTDRRAGRARARWQG